MPLNGAVSPVVGDEPTVRRSLRRIPTLRQATVIEAADDQLLAVLASLVTRSCTRSRAQKARGDGAFVAPAAHQRAVLGALAGHD